MNKTHRKYWIWFSLCYAFILVAVFTPFCTEVSWDKVNESSLPIEIDTDEYLYETSYLAFEQMGGILNIIVILLITLVLLVTTKKWHKYLLVPLVPIYCILLLYNLVSIGGPSWGATPVGGSIRSGFFLMMIGTIALFVIAKEKPVEVPSEEALSSPLDRFPRGGQDQT